MAISFPNNPNINDTIIQAGITYLWNGVSWEVVPDAISFNDVGGNKISFDNGGEITSDPVSGIVLDGPNTVVSGTFSVNGEDVTSSIVGATAFDHDETLFPASIQQKDEALEFIYSDLKLDEDELITHLSDGLAGTTFRDEVSITVTARTGGTASCTEVDAGGDPVRIFDKTAGISAGITATNLAGYSFDHWSGSYPSDIADPTVSTTTVLMNKDQYVTAYFKKN